MPTESDGPPPLNVVRARVICASPPTILCKRREGIDATEMENGVNGARSFSQLGARDVAASVRGQGHVLPAVLRHPAAHRSAPSSSYLEAIHGWSYIRRCETQQRVHFARDSYHPAREPLSVSSGCCHVVGIGFEKRLNR